jgi:hypothetical protein
MESSQNRLEVVIVNNEVGSTVSANGFGGFGGIAVIGGGLAASDNVVVGEIRDNRVGTNNSFGILVSGGLDGAQSARVEAVVDGNLVTQAGLDGILVTGGSDQAQNNTVDTEIRANQVQGVGRDGIHRTEAMVKCSVLNRMTRLEMPETVRLG